MGTHAARLQRQQRTGCLRGAPPAYCWRILRRALALSLPLFTLFNALNSRRDAYDAFRLSTLRGTAITREHGQPRYLSSFVSRRAICRRRAAYARLAFASVQRLLCRLAARLQS